ncbi:ATP-grasp domain-containing protein [Pseudomonadota bacterium]
MARKRVLVIAPHSSYRTPAFIDAANRMGIDVLFASEGKNSVVSAYSDGLHIDLEDTSGALRAIHKEATRHPFSGIIGTDDLTTELAALAAQQLDLPHNPLQAVQVARRKDLARAVLSEKGIPVPDHRCIDLRQPIAPQAEGVRFPCVLKPLALSASRGVIRADNPDQFARACARIDLLLKNEGAKESDIILAEDFIPGFEVAVEGMLSRGKLSILAVFDKPDPLDGPYFEETYYVTPSRLGRQALSEIQQRIDEGCAAYGLREGPVHAECRVNDAGVWLLEIAARTIGGLCARLLSFGTGQSLEELVLAHAMGYPMMSAREDSGGVGVLMIPVPAAGILRRVEGLLAAERTPFIEEVTILVRSGYQLVPWPEGSSYLGFIFARAPTPEQAETALRQSHACLNFVVAPVWNLNPASESRIAESGL